MPRRKPKKAQRRKPIMRLLPWRTYDQMIADDNLPPRGHPQRLAIIMEESFKRGLCESAIACAVVGIAFAIWYWF